MMQSGSRSTLAAARLILPVLAGLLLSEPASAQSGETGPLLERIEQLRRDITDLQRYVYRSGAPAAPGSASSPAGVGTGADDRPAALLHVTALEGDLRGLTGVIEEIRHKVDTAGRRLDKLVEDIDFRLAAIERALAEATTAAGQRTAATQPETGASGAAGAGAASQVPGPSDRPGVLGTLPVGGAPAAGGAAGAVSLAPERSGLLPEGTPRERYDFAFGLLRAGLARPEDLVSAERAFEEFLADHGDHQLADNARYWLGESHYARKDYDRAVAAFVEGYRVSPAGAKAPHNLLKLGMSLSHLGRRDEACATFQELDEKFPDLAGDIKTRGRTEWRRAGCG